VHQELVKVHFQARIDELRSKIAQEEEQFKCAEIMRCHANPKLRIESSSTKLKKLKLAFGMNGSRLKSRKKKRSTSPRNEAPNGKQRKRPLPRPKNPSRSLVPNLWRSQRRRVAKLRLQISRRRLRSPIEGLRGVKRQNKRKRWKSMTRLLPCLKSRKPGRLLS
jgi:hypothetical protein